MYGANSKVLVNYSTTSLANINKKGLLKKSSDGYYTICVGALDFPNNAGDVYTGSHYRDALFNPHGVFQRRMSKGVLYSEYKHPERDPSWSRDEWFGRLLKLEENRYCGHIRSVKVVEGLVDRHGVRFTGVVIEIRPLGPYGPSLQSILDAPDCNSYFSVRSLTEDVMRDNFSYTKNMKECITFDWVGEGGIDSAQKHNSPGLESFTEADVIKYLESSREKGVGLESFGGSPEALATRLGFHGRSLRNHSSLLL